jgi:CheY-like chemotaxis protein
MPIMDGLASTKRIREIETSNATSALSQRASLNGRVPIFAVSASLAERERDKCINAGFDAWVLKPISFPRLNELLGGIVDEEMRKKALYTPGKWDLGGWFDVARPIAAGKTVAGQNLVMSRSTSKSGPLRGKDGSALELMTQDVPAPSPDPIE